MWTSFIHQSIHTGDTFDYIFVEANEPCSKMFLENIYGDCYQDYKAKYFKTPPAITNVTEYKTIGGLYVRVINVDELVELGLTSNCEHHVNLLVCSHECPDHKDINPF